MVARTSHDGDDGSTYVAGMFAVCGGVDIMDDTVTDDLGGWLLGWYVFEENVRPPVTPLHLW